MTFSKIHSVPIEMEMGRSQACSVCFFILLFLLRTPPPPTGLSSTIHKPVSMQRSMHSQPCAFLLFFSFLGGGGYCFHLVYLLNHIYILYPAYLQKKLKAANSMINNIITKPSILILKPNKISYNKYIHSQTMLPDKN